MAVQKNMSLSYFNNIYIIRDMLFARIKETKRD